MPTRIRFETSGLVTTSNESEHILSFLKDEMVAMLQGLMFSTTIKLLQELEDLCKLGNPADWPAIYLSLCTLLFAAESMAIDRYMRESAHEAKRSVLQMEADVMLYILGHLEFSTRGHDPLDLNWSLSKNMALVKNDSGAVYTMRRLQKFRDSHSKYETPTIFRNDWHLYRWF